MRTFVLIFALAALSLTFGDTCVAQTTPSTASGKKLIQYGWDAPDTAYLRTHVEEGKNHFTPAEWQSAVHFALKHTDEYVWIYNERALWWNGRPGEPYEKAITDARHGTAGK